MISPQAIADGEVPYVAGEIVRSRCEIGPVQLLNPMDVRRVTELIDVWVKHDDVRVGDEVSARAGMALDCERLVTRDRDRAWRSGRRVERRKTSQRTCQRGADDEQ